MTELLALKIAKAALDVGGKLSADKTNTEQRYDYISADKILSVCGQALFTQGVTVLPGIAEQETNLFEYVDQYGKSRRRYDSRVEFVFTITDGSETLLQVWVGCGSDYTVPDKALYKAITSGHKYFLMKLLCVGAGNEDGEHETEEASAKNTQQQKRMQAPPPAQKPAKATAKEETKAENGKDNSSRPTQKAWGEWSVIIDKAQALGLAIPPVDPDTVTLDGLRLLYTDLREAVKAAEAAITDY